MGGLLTSFNSGVSGLQTAQSALNTTAHNISNATTTGYSRQQLIVTDSSYTTLSGKYGNYLQVGLGTTIAETRQIRNQFLDDQYRLEIGRQSFYESQYQTTVEIEDLFGELNGEEFATSLNDYWETLQELAREPNNLVNRKELVASASALVDKSAILYDQLKTYQVTLNTDIQSQVTRVNELTSRINELNQYVKKYEASGQSANDYRDERNSLLDELSKYLDYECKEEADGGVIVYVEGDYLVASDRAKTLYTKKVSDDSEMLKVVWDNGSDLFNFSKLSYSPENSNDIGSLKGLIISRGNKTANYLNMPVRPDVADYTNASGVVDQTAYNTALAKFKTDTDEYNNQIAPSTILTVQAQLDNLIHGIVTAVNDILCPNKEITLQDGSVITVLDEENAPRGDDENKTTGEELFSRKGSERYEQVSVTLQDGTVTNVYKYIEEDPSQPNTQYTISNLKVNQDMANDPSLLPLTANASSGLVDGYTIDTISELLGAWDVDFAAIDPNDMTKYTFKEYYNAMIGELGTNGKVWKSIVENQTTLASSVESQRQTIMGVSTDEELSNLIKYQHCYNASSRYITVVNDMLDQLLNKLG